MKHIVSHHHKCTCATNFLHHLGTGTCLQIGPKMAGAGIGALKKIWDPLLSCNRWI